MTDHNEAMRLAEAMEDEGVCMTVLDGLSLQAAALLRQQAERIAELEKMQDESSDVEASLRDQLAETQAERDQHQATATALIALLADIRKACGDNGKRMQPELVEFIGAMKADRDQLQEEVERLKPNAERYEWLRDNHESEWAICEWQDDPDGLGYYRDARAPEFVDAAIDAARTTHKETE